MVLRAGETGPSLRAPTVAEVTAEIERAAHGAASDVVIADVGTPDTPPSTPSADNEAVPSDVPSPEDTARRVLDALRRSAARARRVAAQTGTRLVVVRNGELVIEPVADAASAEAQCRRGRRDLEPDVQRQPVVPD